MLFFEGDRGVLGVSADGAESYNLFHTTLPSLVHQLHAHHKIVVKELRRPGEIGANPAHVSCQVDDDIRLRVGEHAGDILALHQIVFRVAGDKNIVSALALQVAH